MIGWAFTWRERMEERESSMTSRTSDWNAELSAETKLVWGSLIGDTLRRLLPLVQSITVRGFGPEAPTVSLTPLRDDKWLSLELISGLYEGESVPPPTITILENSGLHDGGFWPNDFSCMNDKGCLCNTQGCVTNRSLPVSQQRHHVESAHGSFWSSHGVPLR